MKDVLGPGIKDIVGTGREQDPRNQEALQREGSAWNAEP